MAGKLEQVMWGFKSFINDKELQDKFNEIYQQVLEANKDNVIAFLPIGNIDVDTLDISDFQVFDDYEINSGTRKDDEGNEFDTEAEYIAYIEKKANEKFGKYEIREQLNEDTDSSYTTIHTIYDENGENVDWEPYESEAKDTLNNMKKDWIDEQPDFEDLEMEYHEIYWNTVWSYNGEVDREIADNVGLGYLEMNNSGDEYLFLLGCGMDLTPKLIAYQALAYGCIDEKWLRYFEGSMLKYTKDVVGERVWNEVIEKLGIISYFQEVDAE
ncbi:hypothetical protein [Brevibacillus laterosporus]|uniref:hypothetical protein n=1 Tax=Brevibacillus laterosporus TaxID=1465 RepID=UPI00215BCADD|nr:hypothetical protein [Brevibacillus laterosporus]MCR8994591.1 hypothetical protein [Brevibacillus laterosporus]